ncbi:MAG: hypothetical protein HDR86_00325 [Bacteroides sp.]|nr:hypothetical protein [Bacteroides sp.]
MLKTLLESHFHKAYGLTRAQVNVNSQVCCGTFSLSDPKACELCDSNATCNHQTLLISSDEPVQIINLEEFARQFDGTKAEFEGGVCDFLLFSAINTQMALCDLSCSSAAYVEPNHGKYPEGKRAKALSQMKNSLNKLLYADVLFELKILSNSRKRLIFSWREPQVDVIDPAEQTMMDFITTPDSDEEMLTAEEHGFEFVQIKYPKIYRWENSTYS